MSGTATLRADPAGARFRVQLHSDGSFDYAPDGVLALVLPVPGVEGDMEDIVAWRPDDPRRWWLRRRAAVILGMEEVEHADYLGESLVLHETPADWLEAGGVGAVVLDWQAHLPLHLPPIPIKCATPRLARRLRAALTPKAPKVLVGVADA